MCDINGGHSVTVRQGRLRILDPGPNVMWCSKIYKNNILNITNIFFSYNYVIFFAGIQLYSFSTYYFKHYFEIYHENGKTIKIQLISWSTKEQHPSRILRNEIFNYIFIVDLQDIIFNCYCHQSIETFLRHSRTQIGFQ